MRAMGLDVGTKAVGIAATDELGLTAQPVRVLSRRNLRTDLSEIIKMAAERSIERFVIGLPLNMNGSEGPRAEATRRFGTALAEASSLPVEYQDERLTTVAAERVLLEGNLSRNRRKEVVDQVAAALILQSWLEAQAARRPRNNDSRSES